MTSRIQLMQGCCLKRMQEIESGSVDLICSDLPYSQTSCKWDSLIPFEPLWEQYKRVIKKNGAIVLTAIQPFSSLLVMSNLKWFRYEWIWQKNCGSNFGTARKQPMHEHEHVLVFCEGASAYYPQMQERAKSGLSRIKYAYSAGTKSEHHTMKSDQANRQELRLPGSVQKFNRETGLHSTQKPVHFFEYLIKTYTAECETVLDNCMGSASTGIACLNTNRHFIGIERDEKYFNLAQERITKHQEQQTLELAGVGN